MKKLFFIVGLMLTFSVTYSQKPVPVWHIDIEDNLGAIPSNFHLVDSSDNYYTVFRYRSTAVVYDYSTFDGNASGFGCGIEKFDKDGNELWAASIFGDNSTLEIAATATNKNNELYVLINAWNHEITVKTASAQTVYNTDSSYLLKFTANGQLAWVKGMYGIAVDSRPRGTAYPQIAKMLCDEQNNLYVFSEYMNYMEIDGTRVDHPQGDENIGLCGFKLSPIGNLQELKHLAALGPKGNRGCEVFDIAYYPNDGSIKVLLYFGYSSVNIVGAGGFSSSDDYQFLLTVDKQLDYLQHQQLDRTDKSFIECFEDMPDGGVLYGVTYETNSTVLGASLVNKGGNDYAIIRVDAGGNVVYSKTFGGVNNEYIYDIKLSPDNNYYYIFGSYYGGEATIENEELTPSSGSILGKYDMVNQNVWLESSQNGLSVNRKLIVDSEGAIYYMDFAGHTLKDYQFNCFTGGRRQVYLFLKVEETRDDLFDDITACPEKEIVLEPKIKGLEYNWSTGEETPTITVKGDGVYYLMLDTGNCVFYDSVVVTTQNFPVNVQIGEDTTICEGQKVGFKPVTNADKFLWSTGETTDAIVVSKAGTYSLVVDSLGCVGYDTVEVTTKPSPKVDLGKDTAHCFDGDRINLSANTIADTYLWNTGETTSAIAVNSIGDYSVEVSFNNGCSNTDTLSVKNGCAYTLYMPTAFRPNSDYTENRVFKPIGTRLAYTKLTIYNRWGEMVYMGEDANAQWDGNYKGEPAPQGRYMYMLTFKAYNQDGNIQLGNLSGYFMLLR